MAAQTPVAPEPDEVNLVQIPERPEPRFVLPLGKMEPLAAAAAAGETLRKFWLALQVTFDENSQDESAPARRNRFAKGLDALYTLLSDVGLMGIASEFEELRSALKDANLGINHPLLTPTPPAGKRRSKHRDPSRIWRARANVVLAIEARHKRLMLDKTKEPESMTLEAAAAIVLQRGGDNIVRRIVAKRRKSRLDKHGNERGEFSKSSEKDTLIATALQWRKNLGKGRRRSEKINSEAVELCDVGSALIKKSATIRDIATLESIERRGLKEAQRALDASLSTL